MAQVTLTTAMVGADSYNPGDEFECSEAEAKRLIEAGLAVPVAKAKTERAVRKSPAKETRG